MQTQAEKRQALIWRIVRYGIMILAVIVLTTFLLFLMLGYRFNRNNGTIQQGGLVQFISQPTGAKVTVGTAQLANATRSKITLYPGEYLVKMERTGYDLWQKNITVRAGTVLWLDSARLVPTNRSTQSVKSFATLSDTAVRVTGDSMALLLDNTKPAITLVPLTDGTEVKDKQVIVPANIVTTGKSGTKHLYTFVEWSRDDKHLIMEHTYGAEREFLVVDTDAPEKTTVLRAVGKAVPVETTFDPRSATDTVVRYSDGTVRLASGDKLSEPILTNVASMTMAKGTTILYTTLPSQGTVKTGYLTLGKQEPKELASYITQSRVELALGDYYYDDYLATTVGDTATIEKIPELPSSDSDATIKKSTIAQFKLEDTPLEISVRNKGRLLAFAGKTQMVTYDIELGTRAQAVIQGDRPLTAAPEWLDNQHFWSDANGSLHQYEYDGTNQADIVKVAAGFSAAYTQSGKYLYSIAKTADGYVLQRTTMILN